MKQGVPVQRVLGQRLVAGGAIVGLMMWFGVAPTKAATATPCEKLANIALPNATIDSAQLVPAGAFVQPGGRGPASSFASLPAFCRVSATLTPSSDSDIKTEI